jgi:hypothetical protein
MAKALYAPVGILSGVLGGLVASTIFKQIWKQVSDEPDPPKARQSEYGWKELLPAAALQGAIFTLVKTVVDRGGAKGFERVTGVWPGD